MKKHIILITSILIVCSVIGFLLLSVIKKPSGLSEKVLPTPLVSQFHTNTAITITPTPNVSFASLSLVKHDSSVDVVIDTANKDISAVQLVMSYNPTVLQNMQVSPGSFFANDTILKNTVNAAKGEIFYAAVIPPDQSLVRGKGTILTLSFTVNQGVENPTSIKFLSQTKVTARDIDQSIIKHQEDITFSTTQ